MRYGMVRVRCGFVRMWYGKVRVRYGSFTERYIYGESGVSHFRNFLSKNSFTEEINCFYRFNKKRIKILNSSFSHEEEIII